MAHAKFPAEVLTPEGEVFSEEIEMLSTVTTVGSIGILANHEPRAGDARADRAAAVSLGGRDRALRAGRGLPAVRREPRARARRGGDRSRGRSTAPPSRPSCPKRARPPSAPRRTARRRPGRCATPGATRPSWRSGSSAVATSDRVLSMDSASPAASHFERKRPGWFTTHVFNRIVAALTGSRAQPVRLARARGARAQLR